LNIFNSTINSSDTTAIDIVDSGSLNTQYVNLVGTNQSSTTGLRYNSSNSSSNNINGISISGFTRGTNITLEDNVSMTISNS
jgi:hypothetical protein